MKRNGQAPSALGSRLCLGIGLLITSAIAVRLYQLDGERIEREFQHEVNAYTLQVEQQLTRDIAVLRSVIALFDASDEVTRKEFHAFTRFLLAHYPSMRAVSWIPRVSAAEREAYEARGRADGFEAFEFTERREQGVMVRAGEREEYFPVYYLEPHEGNRAALAFDLASNPVRRRALHETRDTGEPRATGRITLVQEPGDEWAVLIYIPMFHGAPASVAERRAGMRGVISGVYRFRDAIMEAGVHQVDDRLIEMGLYDRLEDGELQLLHSISTGGGDLADTYRYIVPLQASIGREWVLVATPSLKYISVHRVGAPLSILIIGVLITGWLAYHLDRIAKRNFEVEQLVSRRTQEMRKQSEDLSETNTRLTREVRERMLLQQRIAEVTDHEQRRLGQELHDSLGQQIAVTSMLAESLKDGGESGVRDNSKVLGRLAESARNAQAQVRALSRGLVPAEVESTGLNGALADLAQSTAGVSDVDVQFVCGEDVSLEDHTTATHLYRIAQESLRNALEHGRVSRVEIKLERDRDVLQLAVEDDGTGFGEDAGHGSGMASMRYRADLIGATLEISCAPSGGTRVACRLAKSAEGERRPDGE